MVAGYPPPPGKEGVSTRFGAPLILVLAAVPALLSYPFLTRGPKAMDVHAVTLLTGSLAFAAAIFLHAALTSSLRRAAAFLAGAFLLTATVETLGLHTGFPFGARYRYHADLTPVLPGGVPLFIPLAWYVIASTARVLLLAGVRRRLVLAVGGGLALAGVDLFLDPLGVAAGAWSWEGGGPWFGVPPANYAGWVLVGGLLSLMTPTNRTRPPSPRTRRLDLCLSLASVILLLLGFIAATVRTGSILPALASLLVILSLRARRAWAQRRARAV